MKVFFDTNVLIDIFSSRDNESIHSLECFDLLIDNKIKGYISANQLDVFYYVIRKYVDKSFAKECLIEIINAFEVVPFSKHNILGALSSDFNDLEDAELDDVANLYSCKYIVTRNIKDYKNSKKIVITPKDLVTLSNNY